MASRAKSGRERKRRPKAGSSKATAGNKPAPGKKPRARKPYGRNDHRHAPRARGESAGTKHLRETTGVDEDLDYGAATRGHRWSRAPAVSVGGMPDRRRSLGRRASDLAPPESFTRQSAGPPGQRRR